MKTSPMYARSVWGGEGQGIGDFLLQQQPYVSHEVLAALVTLLGKGFAKSTRGAAGRCQQK